MGILYKFLLIAVVITCGQIFVAAFGAELGTLSVTSLPSVSAVIIIYIN